ncbi:MAG TPA: VWA domain-containing protein [Hellea balneolensis]|uniref:VWA domain-containing protein n=1 Tax=Hellea balneolensis TaxID=287478 RepID=A0A7V5NWF6_9PROT|nr:VWA domain-containing protein [Hellea balneolensis]
MRKFGVLVGVLLPLFLVALPVLAQDKSSSQKTEVQGKTIIVFDASGSMWGQIDGKPKISIAREVFDGVLAGWNKEQPLGLIAYGHRRKGDCSDIEEILPPGKVDPQRFKKTLAAINPKGKTPISKAVRMAAEKLKYEENKATVILITDGLETCNADPCATAAELEKLGVDFTTHVIGFDVKKEESEKLRCIAENTGGQYFTAATAAELTGAMNKVAKVAAQPYNLILHAREVKDGPELKDGISWTIWAIEDGKVADKLTTFSYGAPGRFSLAPGDWRIRGEKGNAVAYKDVTIKKDEPLEVTLLLGSGKLKVRGRLSDKAEGDIGDWWIYPIRDGKVAKKSLSFSFSSPETFTLPAGRYRVWGKEGDATASKEVEVKAGETTDVTVVFDAGRLTVRGRLGRDGKKDIGDWWIYPIHDGKVANKSLSFSFSSPKTFTLNAGRYRVWGKEGDATASKDVEVKAGKTTDVTLYFKK